jgi:hypothetical protein
MSTPRASGRTSHNKRKGGLDDGPCPLLDPRRTDRLSGDYGRHGHRAASHRCRDPRPATRDQTAYCPLPPGYRAVYDCADGTLCEEGIVALWSDPNGAVHRPVTFSPLEGFGDEGKPVWYLAPGESLADAEASIRECIERRARRLATIDHTNTDRATPQIAPTIAPTAPIHGDDS